MRRFFHISLLIFITLIFVVISTVLVRAALKPELNSEIRQRGIGNYVELSRGVVHYQLNRVENEKALAVLVHGISVPMVVWDKNVPQLNSHEISTLRMDLYGRGFSDRPAAKYNMNLYITQIRELLDSLQISQPVHLVGISMGGAVAAHYAVAYPDQTASVTLIDAAVNYRGEDEFRPVERMKKIYTTVQNIRQRQSKRNNTALRNSVKEQLRYRGVEFTLLSMMLFGNSKQFINSYRILADKEIPTQIIWGEDDPLFPLNMGKRLSQEFDPLAFHPIPNAGHTPHYEQPDLVNPILTNFITPLNEESGEQISKLTKQK